MHDGTRNLTITEVARRLGIDYGQVWRHVNDHRLRLDLSDPSKVLFRRDEVERIAARGR